MPTKQPPDIQAIQDQIRKLIHKINQAWRSGQVQELENYFHEDIVIRGPELTELARGKAACIKSYADFLTQARIVDYKDSEPQVDVAESTAVAITGWEMTYQLSGNEYCETGHDVFTFVQENEKWLAVWRLMLIDPQK